MIEKPPHERLRGAYLEMPGLRLNARQAARLCGSPEAVVASALASLAAEGFLVQLAQGEYGLRGTCPVCE